MVANRPPIVVCPIYMDRGKSACSFAPIVTIAADHAVWADRLRPSPITAPFFNPAAVGSIVVIEGPSLSSKIGCKLSIFQVVSAGRRGLSSGPAIGPVLDGFCASIHGALDEG